MSMSLSFAAGLLSPMKSLDGRDVTTMPQDRFLLGGPLMLRGFAHNSVECSQEASSFAISQKSQRSKSAVVEELACYLGGKAFWRSCAQAYFPLPYLSRKNTWIADNVKGHVFAECGSLGSPANRAMLLAFNEDWTSWYNLR